MRGASRAVGAAVFALAASAAGVASAAWVGDGSGTGYTTIAPHLAATTSGASATGPEPGAASPATFEVTNPNPYAVLITAVTPAGSLQPETCPGFSFPAQTELALYVPPAATAPTTVTLSNAVVAATDASSDCVGTTMSVPLDLDSRPTPTEPPAGQP
jgi:hypothetical protein